MKAYGFKITKIIRDFVAQNYVDHRTEQPALMLLYAADTIDRLIRERDDAVAQVKRLEQEKQERDSRVLAQTSVFKVSPRPLGRDWTPGCYCCGGEYDLYANLSFFVNSRDDGESLVTGFGQGARLDYRDYEPNWIQVKVGACDKHVPNLERLAKLVYESNHVHGVCVISHQMIQESRALSESKKITES